MIELSAQKKKYVYTIGHSTRPLETFISLLHAHGVNRIVDIRKIPRSRHNPQFNQDTLPVGLAAAGLGYTHMVGLGGLRHARPDSVNTAWLNLSFRGFADYMESSEFLKSLDQLIDLAQCETIAVMCAEAVPWRCHRSLIADALLAREILTFDIMNAGVCRLHALTPWASIRGTKATYSPEPR